MIATNHSAKFEIFNRTANQYYIQIEKPGKNKQPNIPARVRFDKYAKSQAAQPLQTPFTATLDAKQTPGTTPNATAENYADDFNFALSKNFMKNFLASLTSVDAILREAGNCLRT